MSLSRDEDDFYEWDRISRFIRKAAPQIHEELVLITGHCSVGYGCDTFDCLRRSDGKKLWSFKGGPRYLSQPIVSPDGWIYIAEASGAIRSLDARSGEICWEVETGSDEGVPYRPWHDDHPSIALVDDSLFHLDERGLLRAYDRYTGALERERRISCSIVKIECHADDVWISDREGTITSIDPMTLATRWNARLPGRLKVPVKPAGEHLLVLLDRGDLVARRRDDGQLHWWLDAVRTVARQPYNERCVVAVKRGGGLAVIDVASGETAPLGHPLIRTASGEVVVAEHHLFVVTADGVVRSDHFDGTAWAIYPRRDRFEIATLDYADGVLYVFERGAQGILSAVEGDRVRWRVVISEYHLT